MLDSVIRRGIDPYLDTLGQMMHRRGIGANAVTVIGFVIGLVAAGLVVADAGAPLVLLAFAMNRLCDGLDGAIARAAGRSDFGGFLDIVLDFAIYGALPLAFAIRDPAHALPVALLILSFYVNGTTFLAFAAIAARRGDRHPSLASKSLLFSAGLAEGTETILATGAMILWPEHLPAIAYGFAAICFASAAARTLLAAQTFQ